jgi:general secretion pathway protein A
MYLEYYNFKCKPFDLVPNPEFIYFSKTHKRAITYLNYGITERAGFILLTGEVGSGKTTIIRDLIERHADNILLGKVFNTNVNAEQLIEMINDDFEIPIKGKDKISLLKDLNHFLVEQYAKGSRPVLIIDEAQNLSAETLEEVRMLSNLETSDSKLLQIILVGQPELRELLAKPELRQLRQRISIQCHLLPLTRQELDEYIFHRLEVAGNRDALLISKRALDAIYSYSGGIPRLINILGEFLLLSAYAEDVRYIEEEMIIDIAGDLDLSRPATIIVPGHRSSLPVKAADGAAAEPGQDHSNVEVIERQMAELSSKIETVEKNVQSVTLANLETIKEKLDRQYQESLDRIGRIESVLSGISEKKDSISPDPADGKQSQETDKNNRQGLFSRFFG